VLNWHRHEKRLLTWTTAGNTLRLNHTKTTTANQNTPQWGVFGQGFLQAFEDAVAEGSVEINSLSGRPTTHSIPSSPSIDTCLLANRQTTLYRLPS
jgi:hypothetical protein